MIGRAAHPDKRYFLESKKGLFAQLVHFCASIDDDPA
jgi:hypothetical protein